MNKSTGNAGGSLLAILIGGAMWIGRKVLSNKNTPKQNS